MEEQNPERRRAIRIKKPLTVQYRQDTSVYKWDMSTVKDFSEVGMLITTENEYSPDTVLNFRFKLPSNPFEWLELNARVVGCEKRTAGSQGGPVPSGYSTKIEFVDIKPEQTESIRMYINWFLNQGGQGK